MIPTVTLLAFAEQQQQYAVSTVAGGDAVRDNGDAVLGIFENISATAMDVDGNLYIADSLANRIRKVTPNLSDPIPELRYIRGVITTFAGTGAPYFSGDGGPANQAALNRPTAVAVDRDGNVYIADSVNRRIRRVDSDGVITTIMGDDTPLGIVAAMAFDRDNILHFLEVDPPTGLGSAKMWTPAGTVTVVVGSEGLRNPVSMAFAPDNTLYIVEIGTNSVLRVAADGSTSKVDAPFIAPRAVTFDLEGNLYVGDAGNRQIFKVSSDGTITPILPPLGGPVALLFDREGNLLVAFTQQINLWVPGETSFGAPVIGEQNLRGRDGGPATESLIFRPVGVAPVLDKIFITSSANPGVREVGQDGIIQSIRVTQGISNPGAVLVDRDLNLWVTDPIGNRVVQFSALGGTRTFGGTTETPLIGPNAMALDNQGRLYVFGANRIRRIDTISGLIEAFAEGPLTAIAIDAEDNIYLADARQIRKLSPDGAQLDVIPTGAFGLAIDDAGNLIFSLGHSIYMLDASTNERHRIAGSDIPGYSDTQFNNPGALSYDPSTGAIFVVDRGNHRIRKLTPVN